MTHAWPSRVDLCPGHLGWRVCYFIVRNMLLCQVSDPHVTAQGRLAYGEVDTGPMLVRCVDQILRSASPVDAVVVTGDLVDLGTADEYARLRSILQPLPMPVYLLPGNHDDRAAMRAGFGDHPWLSDHDVFIQYAVDDFAVRIVVLDSTVPRQGGGLLCAERLAWLDRTLSVARNRPTIVALHHPPFQTGIAYMDRIGLVGADGFEEVIRKHPQVERVVAGHLHRAIEARFGGTVASTCPSTAHQVTLGLQPESPGCFSLEPPGYQLHRWDGRRVVTHTQPIGDFPGPFLFRPKRTSSPG